MSKGLKASETTLPALEQAVGRFGAKEGLMMHSDQGVQYACHGFRDRLAKNGMVQSMSSKGNCYDNAVAESFFSTLKKNGLPINVLPRAEKPVSRFSGILRSFITVLGNIRLWNI